MSEVTPQPRRDQPSLIPALGIFSATMLVAGGVIGSGIFRKPGVMAAQVGSPELLLGVWLLAGVVSLLGTLSNAELASMMPRTGGQYVFLQRAYGPFVAFLYGWALFAVIQSGSIAALAYVFAEYSTQLVNLPETSASLAAHRRHRAIQRTQYEGTRGAGDSAADRRQLHRRAIRRNRAEHFLDRED